MNEIEQLQRLAALETFKAEDKAELVPLLEKYGIDKPTKTSCKSCWRDAAILALREAKKATEPAADPTLPRLRGDAARDGVYHKGRFIHNDIMTPELAEWMRQNNFPEQLLEQ